MVTLRQEMKDSFDRNAMFIMASYAASAIFGLIFWLVVARLYPPDQVGIGTCIVSAMMLIASLSSMGFDFVLVRFLPQAENPRAMINTCLTITALVATALATIFVFKLPQLDIVRSSPILMLFFVGFAASIAVSQLQDQVFIAYRRAKFAILQCVVNGLRVAVIVRLASLGINGMLSAIGISSVIALAAGFIITRKLQKDYHPLPTINAQVARIISKFSLSNYLASIFVTLPAFILPLIIVSVLSPESSAYFFIPFQMSFALGMIATAITYSFLAECSHEVCNIREQVFRATRLTLAITIPALVVLVVFGSRIFSLFGVTYCENCTHLLWIFSAGWMLYIITNLYLTIARLKLNTRMMTLTNILLAALTLGLGTVLMRYFGLTGVAIGFLIAQGTVAAITLPRLLREIEVSPRVAFSPKFAMSIWKGEPAPVATSITTPLVPVSFRNVIKI